VRDSTHEGRAIGVVVDGMGWREAIASAVHPLRPSLISQETWPAWTGHSSDLRYLRWLAERFEIRPLLGITSKPVLDESGIPLRGAARLGEGVALVSSASGSRHSMQGVLRHEVAHALGMDHCGGGQCALERCSWPMSAEGRSDSLCPSCRRLFDRLCMEWSP
jgi:hypothetical protein